MYAEHLTATGNHAVLFKISACWPIAPTGLQGVSNAEALMASFVVTPDGVRVEILEDKTPDHSHPA